MRKNRTAIGNVEIPILEWKMGSRRIVAKLNGGLRFCWHHLIQRASISRPQISHCAATLSSHLIILPAPQPKSKTRFPSRNEKSEELAILIIELTCASPKLRYS